MLRLLGQSIGVRVGEPSETRPPLPAEPQQQTPHSNEGIPPTGSPPLPPRDSVGVAYMLGRRYEPMPPGGLVCGPLTDDNQETQRERFMADAYSTVWFSYRKNFAPIGPDRITSDAGWGCMLRSGQMLLCQALLRHFLGDKWSLAENSALADSMHTYRLILSWFRDAKEQDAPYSIQNLAELGLLFRTPIGEYHGPHSVAHILQMVVNKHSPASLTCVVGTDGTLYAKDVLDRFNAGASSVLVLLPLRLGVELNPIYLPALHALLCFSQSVGFAGGKASSSLVNKLGTSLRVKRLRALQSMYLIGGDSEGYFYCLDPHTTQPSIGPDARRWTQEQLRTFHTSIPRRMHQSSLDPSVLLGFLIPNEKSFEIFRKNVAALRHCPFIIADAPRAVTAASQEALAAMINEEEDEDDDFAQQCPSPTTSEPESMLSSAMNPLASVAPFSSTYPTFLQQITPVRRKDLVSYLSPDGPVWGVVVVSFHKVYFEPLKQEPLVQAHGQRRYRFTIDLQNIRNVRLESEVEQSVVALDDKKRTSEFVLLSSVVMDASASPAGGADAASTASAVASSSSAAAPSSAAAVSSSAAAVSSSAAAVSSSAFSAAASSAAPPPVYTLGHSNEASVRRLLTNEETVRAVLLHELQGCISRLQARYSVRPQRSVVHDDDPEVRLLVERIELILRHGIRETVSLFGDRSAPLKPLIVAAITPKELSTLQRNCGAAPDDAFFTCCYIRLALSEKSLLSGIMQLTANITATGKGYHSYALLARPDQVVLLRDILQGLDLLDFQLSVVDFGADEDETGSRTANAAKAKGDARIEAQRDDGVDAAALAQTNGYAEAPPSYENDAAAQTVRIEANGVYIFRCPAGRQTYDALATQVRNIRGTNNLQASSIF